MTLFCGLFSRLGRAKDRGDSSSSSSSSRPRRRTRTLSMFGNSNPQSMQLLRRMVGVTAFAKVADESSSQSSTSSDYHMSTDMYEALRRLYDELRGRASLLSRDSFARFLQNVQAERSVDLDRDAYAFGEFLYVCFRHYGTDAAAPPPPKDLSRPITNYFINSSHNTYLDGHQWASRSSPEAYRSALLRGCRCIEIDVWNGDSSALAASTAPDDVAPPLSLHWSADPRDSATKLDALRVAAAARSRHPLPRGEPVVTHGWTLTTPCGFRDVCEAIRDSAFVDNPLPVIISLEVHADVEQQEVMVVIMRDVWRGLLVTEPLDGCDPRFRVPALEALQNRILVKVKRAKPNMQAARNVSGQPAAFPNSDDVSLSDDDRPAVSRSQWPDRLAAAPTVASTVASDKSAKVRPICESLAELAVYTRSQRFESFDTPQAKLPTHIFSISENRILEMCHNRDARDVFVHNKSYFMRAFPAVRRIDSSNPDPSLFWRTGVQMVAMNWQNLDEGMMLNEGMFADEKGWVLKPPGYQSSDKSSEAPDPTGPGHTLDLAITLFAAHNLPTASSDHDGEHHRGESAIRPVVKVELHVNRPTGPEKDGLTSECSYKQRTDAARTSHPSFGEAGKTLEFRNVPRVTEKLGFVRFKIEDESRSGLVSSPPLLAWACIRLDRLRQGYRFVRLLDTNRTPGPGGKLLVKVSKVMR